MKIPFVDLIAQYESIKSEIDRAIAAVISESAFIKGHYPQAFERQFAEYLGVQHCVSCANGTDAIEIVLRSFGIGAGDEVIVPANTWISTAEAVTSVGATVVFVDPHPTRYTIEASEIEKKISSRTRAVIPVHLYGLPADMPSILALAKQHKFYVIEDCAQAHGARIRGATVGTFGDAATFSFFPSKNLGAFGDAGAIVTNHDEIAKSCRMISDHGRLGKFDHGLEGRNSRLDGIQAAILIAKLPHLPRWTKLRQEHAALYANSLARLDIQLPEIPQDREHVFHLYVVQVTDRDRIQSALESAGIATGIHYPIALPFTKAYERLGARAEDFPVAHKAMTKILSLPMYPELTQASIEYICKNLKETLQNP